MARQHTEVFLQALSGAGFAEPNPTPMFPNPPGLLRLEPHSAGLRDRIWWGAGSRATAQWAAKQGMNMQSSTLLTEDAGMPFHELPGRADPAVPRGVEGGRARARAAGLGQPQHLCPYGDRDRAYFGRGDQTHDQVGFIDAQTKAIFGRSYAAEPEALVRELAKDTAIQAADTLLLTVPNQLGVDYNAHVIESVLKFVAPGLAGGKRARRAWVATLSRRAAIRRRASRDRESAPLGLATALALLGASSAGPWRVKGQQAGVGDVTP